MARAIGRSPETEALYFAKHHARRARATPEGQVREAGRSLFRRVGLEIALLVALALAGVGFGAAVRHVKGDQIGCASCAPSLITVKQ